jgi:hypothetical protein
MPHHITNGGGFKIGMVLCSGGPASSDPVLPEVEEKWNWLRV